MNMFLAVVWLWVAWQISRYYRGKELMAGNNMPPRLYHRMEDRTLLPGTPFEFQLPADTFIDPDEGDVLTISAHQAEHDDLPAWLDFEPETLGFSGIPPVGAETDTRLVLRATDFDGAWAEGKLVLRHSIGKIKGYPK